MKLFTLGTLVVCLACGGCESSLPEPPRADPASGADPLSAAPRLQAGDKIRVTVYGEDRLTGEYELDGGGFVSMPLAGTVRAAGLTKPEVEQALAAKFRGSYLRDPKVTVDIAAFRPFYVLGEVAKPGEYPFKSGLNVLSAIAVAGGQTYRASSTRVSLQRSGESAARDVPMSAAIPVFPGDLIRIPERYF